MIKLRQVTAFKKKKCRQDKLFMWLIFYSIEITVIG
jgi:hypothetical protein